MWETAKTAIRRSFLPLAVGQICLIAPNTECFHRSIYNPGTLWGCADSLWDLHKWVSCPRGLSEFSNCLIGPIEADWSCQLWKRLKITKQSPDTAGDSWQEGATGCFMFLNTLHTAVPLVSRGEKRAREGIRDLDSQIWLCLLVQGPVQGPWEYHFPCSCS